MVSCAGGCFTHVNDVESLVDGSLGVEGESCVNLGGDLSWNDLEDLLSELDEKAVESCVYLLIDVLAVLLAVLDGGINETLVLLLLGSGLSRVSDLLQTAERMEALTRIKLGLVVASCGLYLSMDWKSPFETI